MQTTDSTLNEMFTTLNGLDVYTQLSVLGSWAYTINSACINAAMRYVPEAPDSSGIDGFNRYEAARASAIKDADESRLPALLQLQADIDTAIGELDGEARGVADTFRFLSNRQPTREQFVAEYTNRQRQGCKPNMTVRQFVDFEFERAMQQHDKLVACGDDAVRICETLQFNHNRGYNDLPEWIVETFERKLVDKLQARWLKLELVRSDPRRRKEIRDAATADQLMIAEVLAKYDAEPPYDDTPEPDEQAEQQITSFPAQGVSPTAVIR